MAQLDFAEQFSQQDPGDVYRQLGPNFSNQERLVTQALMTATIPGQVLQAQVRPNIPGIDPFPRRWGYPPYQDRQYGIEETLDVPRTYRNRRDDLSGGVAATESATRNMHGDVF
jgi:hypothetical protein